MKTRFYSILMAVACIIGLQSCDNDDDNLRVSPELQKAFLEKYPAATRVEWETKAGYYVADFMIMPVKLLPVHSGRCVVHDRNGVLYVGLPEAVKAAFEQGDYSTWTVDDVDKLERRDMETVYVIEVEKKPQEMDLYYSAEGLLIKAVADTDHDDDYESHLPIQAPEAILSFINDKYPDARLIEIEVEQGVTEVEIVHEGRCKEVRFDKTNNWISTSWDIRRNELPAVVTQALANSEYSTYTVDDAEYYEAPQGDYYQIELEQGAKEVKVKIDTTGKFI